MDASLLLALVLGIVEGVTEFLPISSTGHLIVAGSLLGFSDARAGVFYIAIQTGAMLAVVWEYRSRFFRVDVKLWTNLAVAFMPAAVFGLLFGALLTTIGDKGRPVIEFFDGANEAIMKLVALIMWIAPLGIFGLVAAKFGESKDLGAELARIGWYITTVLVGLAIHGGVVLPTLLWVFGRRNPLQFAVGMGKALLTAFSTASSSATLPLTIECAIDANRVSKRAVLFVVPIGATVNMNGTALYESVAAMFIAQAYGIPLGLGDQALIFVTATLAAVGAAGIPEAGLFTMVLVLKAVGLPLEGIALLLVVDWFLDRCRTTVNVWEDGIAAAIIDRMTGVGAEEPDLDAVLPRGPGMNPPTPAPGT